jgi:hypothetical protein
VHKEVRNGNRYFRANWSPKICVRLIPITDWISIFASTWRPTLLQTSRSRIFSMEIGVDLQPTYNRSGILREKIMRRISWSKLADSVFSGDQTLKL